MEIIRIQDKHASCYLIASEKGYFLFDALWPNSKQEFEKQLKVHGIALKQIIGVAVSHLHPDHVGLIPYLMGVGIPVYLHETQIASIPIFNQFVLKHPELILTPFSIQIEKLANLSFEGFFIPTKGHSDDSISLVFPNDCAFIGDLPAYSYLGIIEDHEIQESWQKLLSYGIHTVYPAHGMIEKL